MQLEEMILKLFLAFAAGGLVGLEREWKDRPAGLRTHMLVAGGSTLMTLVSLSFTSAQVDPTRIAAQIVTGIGFLGAGTIFRAGNSVRGLTTAAGLWTVAGIGMSIAAGGTILYLGLITALSVFVVNRWIGNWEKRRTSSHAAIVVRTARGSDVLARIVESLSGGGVSVKQIHWITDEAQPEVAAMELVLEVNGGVGLEELGGKIGSISGVKSVEWE